ncbi:hypothetical protein Vafri_18452 [Volvox africanus]|uniref:Uncharacterized protein n=1 Tax=Volvox africanus TaxID=51714 RepID=A0A8J4BN44_9CHLO|nr:hypothetical protein Vafri_18452 [Volvox africanus]
MPVEHLRHTGSRISSPCVVNGLMKNDGNLFENLLSDQTITTTLAAADVGEDAAQPPTRFLPSFPLRSPRLSEGSSYSDDCSSSWGAASQSCADEACSADLLSNGTSIGGISGTGCSLGGSSLNGLTCSIWGANSSSNGGSCHNSGDCCNGVPASAVGFAPRLRLPLHVTAALKYGSLPRKCSLGAVAEQLDGIEKHAADPAADPTSPSHHSAIGVPHPSGATSHHSASAQFPPLSDHVVSLHESWSLVDKEVVAGRTQEAPALQASGSIGGSEPQLSLLGGGPEVQREQECLGQAGVMISPFDDAIIRSSGLAPSSPTHTPGGVTVPAPLSDSPLMSGSIQKAVSAAHFHSRFEGSSNGGHTRSSTVSSLRVLSQVTTAADSVSEEATASPISTVGNLAQRPVPASSRVTDCVGNPAGVPTASRKATYAPTSIPVPTAARPQPRSAMTSQNTSQTSRRSISTSTPSQTAVRPPFNPYCKPSTKVTAAFSTQAGTHVPSVLAPPARTRSVGSGIPGAAGRKQGTRIPRVGGQQPVQAGHPAATAGGHTQAGRRNVAPPPLTTTSQVNNAASAAAPAAPQRSGLSGSNRNIRPLRPPSSAAAAPRTLSPNAKKIVNTVLSGMSRAAAVASVTTGPPGNSHRPLRPAVCRYSVNSSVCSDGIPSICQASSLLAPTEGPNAPRRQSQQRLQTKQQPHTWPSTVCSPADTFPVLRRQYFAAPDGHFYPGQPLPPTPPLCGIEDIMPMASPIPAAIEDTCTSMPTAAPRAVRGVRERRRQLDKGWPWTASGSPLLSGGEESHMNEGPSGNCRVQVDALARRCCSGSDDSGGSDAEDDFGLPAWAWRSVADLLSQSTDAASRREQQLKSPETERQPPQQQLLSYAENDPSLVPLRRLSGTPHRRRGPCAITSPLLQPHMLVGAGVPLNSTAAVPDELSKRSHCQRRRPTVPSKDEDEESSAVLLSRQAARRRYGRGSPTLAGQFVAGDGSLVAMASASHSSDTEEPSEPLLPVHDDVGGWQGDTGHAPSPAARLLPFSGSHIDELVFASLRLSSTNPGLIPGLLAEEAGAMEAVAEETADGHCAHRLAAPAAALDADGFSRYQLGRESTFTEEAVSWTLQPCPDSPSADSCEDTFEPHNGTMHSHHLAGAAAMCTDVSVILGSTRELCPETIGCPEVLELSAVLSLLGAVNALISTSSTNSSTNCAPVADSTAPWDTIWGAALCAAGAMTAPVTTSTFVSISLLAAAGMAAAMLLADKARVMHCQRDLVAPRRAVNGLGRGGLGAGPASLRRPLHTRKSISAAAGRHTHASCRLSDTASTASDVQDTTGNKEHYVRRKGSRSIESAQDSEQHADSDDPAPGCALSSAGNVAAVVEQSRDNGADFADGYTQSLKTRKSLVRIATEAVDACAEALSAMRAAGSDRAALRRLARACGVYAGLQMATSARCGSDAVDLTSSDWSVVQSLIMQRLSWPQRPAAQSSVNIIAPAANAPATQDHMKEVVPASFMEAGAGNFGKGADLRDGDRPGCGMGLGAELDHRLRPFPATIAADAAAAVLDSPVAQRRPAGTPQGIEAGAKTRVAMTGTVPALPPHDQIKSASLLSPSNVASYKGGSELSQHFNAAIAAAASEGAAVAFLTIDKSVNEEEKLVMLAGTHCLLSSSGSRPVNASFSITAVNAAATFWPFPVESSPVLEASASSIRHEAYMRPESMYSSISTPAAANEAAAMAALAAPREEVLATHAVAAAKDGSLSLQTASAVDIASQQLLNERNTFMDVCLAMEAEPTLLHATFGEEDAMQAFNAEGEQPLMDIALALAADAAISAHAELACARAMGDLWSQRQQLLDCITCAAAADAAAVVQAVAGEEAAIAAYTADRQELLSLVSFTNGTQAAVAVQSSIAAMTSVPELLRQRSLQLPTVAEMAAADSAVVAVGLEDDTYYACSERRREYSLAAASDVYASESRIILYSSLAEEVALASLAQVQSVPFSVCFAVEAMDAAAALGAAAAEEAAEKALARRHVRCTAASASAVAAATTTAIRAATAQEAGLAHLAVLRQHGLTEYASSVAVDVKARASAEEVEEVAHERLYQERCALLPRQEATEAAAIAIATQLVATDEETCVLAEGRQGLTRLVDASVGTSDLVNAASARRTLEMCALGFLEVQKQRLSLYAAVLGTNLAAMVAAASANIYGGSTMGRRGDGTEWAGGEDGQVYRSHIRCFPLRSVGGEEVDEGEPFDEKAQCKSRVLKSFPVNLTSGSNSDGEEQDEDSDDGYYDVVDQMM